MTMPEEGRESLTPADVEDDYAWDGERTLPEWTDSDEDVLPGLSAP